MAQSSLRLSTSDSGLSASFCLFVVMLGVGVGWGEWGHTQGLAPAKQMLSYAPSPSMMVVRLCSEALQWVTQFCEAVTALVPHCFLSVLRFFP